MIKNMEKIIVLICLIVVNYSYSQDGKSNYQKNNSFKLTASIQNLKDSLWVGLTKMDRRNFYSEIIDSTMSINGSFKFQGKLISPSEYMIDIIDYEKREIKRLYLWLENSEITIIGNYNDFENAQVHGSRLTTLSKDYENIAELYRNQIKRGEINSNNYKKKLNKKRVDFLFKNLNNSVSLAYFLYFTDNVSKDSLQLFYSKLDKKFKNSKNGITLKNSFEIEKIKIGNPFIDIEAKDLEGNIVKLSDFKGKIIVLDFWAYWCHYCHEQNQEEFPKLKEKYKNEDFVIISYSVDVNKQDWEKSSKSDNIDWINISNLEGVTDKYVTQYGVQGYPTSFIIDKDGTVLKQISGYVYNALESELDKIFSREE